MQKKLNLLLTLILLAVIVSLSSSTVAAQEPVATVDITSTEITWQPLSSDYSSLTLTISGPDGFYSQEAFSAGNAPSFGLFDQAGQPHPDGPYAYELLLTPALDPAVVEAMSQVTEENRAAVEAQLREAGKLPPPLTQAGYFAIAGGAMILGDADEGGIGVLDQVILDDLIVTGSICTGADCNNGESFGFETIRLKENNLRIRFMDTSTSASFPSNDWQIAVNDTSNGGRNRFSIEDIDGGRTPFTIEASAPTHSLYVEDSGRIGLGTSTPVVEIHVTSGDTPDLRLEQTGTSGFTPQTWDVAGNEANFFIRDVTNGSTLPFKIQPGAPDNGIYMASDGDLGMGTTTPYADLHVYQIIPSSAYGLLVGQNTSLYNLLLDGSGNLAIDGVLTESSDVNAKENISPVDRREILARLAELEISEWTYKDDLTPARHLGPMAQDFYAAFELGQDDTRIASLDASGVALAAIQELYRVSQKKDNQIEELQQQNAELEARLKALEKLVEGMIEQ